MGLTHINPFCFHHNLMSCVCCYPHFFFRGRN